jgi:hypothetical protein
MRSVPANVLSAGQRAMRVVDSIAVDAAIAMDCGLSDIVQRAGKKWAGSAVSHRCIDVIHHRSRRKSM